MPQIVDRFTNAALAAGAEERPFNGRNINIAKFSGYLEVGVVGGAGIVFDVLINGIAVATSVRAQTSATFPVLPDQLDVVDLEVRRGSIIEVVGRNPTGGALATFYYIKLSTQKRAAR